MNDKPAFNYHHPHPAVAVDVVIFTLRDARLDLLLIERGREPFLGQWALPGGFVRIDESLDSASRRELREETGVEQAYLEQIGAFGEPDRDPRERVISVGFYAILASHHLELRAGTDARSARWWPHANLPALAFDHALIVAAAHARMVDKLGSAPIALQFLPREFTLSDFQHVFEAIRGEAVDKRNFRKWAAALPFLRATGKFRTGEQNRPPALYRGLPGAVRDPDRWIVDSPASIAGVPPASANGVARPRRSARTPS